MRLYSSFSSNERRLLLSFLFFIIAWPVFGVFANTFLWRHSQDILTVIVFNLGLYLGLPLGFFINSALLHHFPSKTLFFFGCILQGVGPLLLTLINPSSYIIIAILGACLGLPMGLYWGNRNLMTLRITEGQHRMHFLSMESFQNTAVGTIIPILVGIYLVSFSGGTSMRYLIVTVLAFTFLLIAGALIASLEIKIPHVKLSSAWITHASAFWNRLRWFEFFDGVITANEGLLSLMMVLVFLGMEDAVGGTKSGVAILAAIMMYFFGKRIRTKDYTRVIQLSLLLIGGSAATFALFFNAWSVIVCFAAFGLINGFRATTMMSVIYRAVDEEVARTQKNRFAYLLDREIFLNIGRLTILLVLFVSIVFAPTLTLRYGLLLTSFLHIPLLFSLQKLKLR